MYMDSKRAGTIALFGVILLAVLWGLLSFMPEVVPNENTSDSASALENSMREVDVQYSAKNSMHTFSGVIDLPTPCHVLNSTTSVIYSEPAVVSVALTIVPPTETEICAQVVTPQEFSTTISSEVKPEFAISVDGAEAKAVIRETPVGQ